MTSSDEMRSDFKAFEEDWADVKPYLLQYLPGDKRTGKADRLMRAAKQYLGRALQAHEKQKRPAAFWWYALALARMREHNRLALVLGELGLQAQAEAKKRRKATA